MTAKVRILIVDDEAHVLSALKRLFRLSGYETVTCTTAREALTHMETSAPFHIVISDYRMPEMNGVEFLTKVRICSPDSVRMVISGYADAGSIIAATNEGHIYKFIPKPWDDAFLLASVADALQYYEARQEQQTLIAALKLNLTKMSAPIAGEQLNYQHVLQVYESLLDFMPVGLIGIDANGIIVKMNHFVVSHLKLDSAMVGSNIEALPSSLSSLISDNEGTATVPEAVSLDLNGHEVTALIKPLNQNGMEGLMLIIVLVPTDAKRTNSAPMTTLTAAPGTAPADFRSDHTGGNHDTAI